MSSRPFETLQNINEWKWPAILIPKRFHEHMNMVRHDHDCVQLEARRPRTPGRGRPRHILARENPAFSQTVFKDHRAGRFRQNHSAKSAERDKQVRIRLLNMWQSAVVVVLRENWICGHSWRCV